jgi:murein DD-endopeptidase MepM/ murein hydrolase activator NlpD
VPPADDAPSPARRRSPLLVRALLLGACGAGLLGLSLPDGSSDTPAALAPTIAVDTAASTSSFDAGELRRTPVAVPGVAPKRASRSRVASKAASGAWFRPSGAGIVSPFGMRWGRMHEGVDFGARYGAPIRAIGDGVVVGAGYLPGEGGYGQLTLIRHKNGIVSAYAHQSRMLVRAGDRVTAGEVIGYVGSTGHVTGPHLHFEIRTSTHGGQIDPVSWLRKHGVYV